MAVQNGSQPEVRFHKVGPNSIAGVSYLPKSILVKKVWGTQAESDDFLTLPAGSFITHAYAVCTIGTGNANVQVSLGLDGSTVAFIPYTNFTCQTAGQSYQFNTGTFLSAADTLRVTIGGTGAAAGEAIFVIQYFETAAMQSRGYHIET